MSNTIRIAQLPYKDEKVLIQGTTFLYPFTLMSFQNGQAVADADPIDLTGHDFSAVLTDINGQEINAYSVGGGITVDDPESGTAILRIEAGETSNFVACCHNLRIFWSDDSDPATVRLLFAIKIDVKE